MLDEVRGSHACFLCGCSISWAANVFGGVVICHGSEVIAHAAVSARNPAMHEATLAVQLHCPECNAINQFHAPYTLS